MSYISEEELSNYRGSTKTFSADNIVKLNESYYSNIEKPPMVFLSHKHDEYDILQGVVAFLKKEGVDVYIDWLDDSMPVYTNSETAHKLKEKIKVADKFILVATPEAINSKWCNWELGLGDAEKYMEHIALLPVNRTNKSFNGSEYLKIYPRIEYIDRMFWDDKNRRLIYEGYYVIYPNRSSLSLRNWLQK